MSEKKGRWQGLLVAVCALTMVVGSVRPAEARPLAHPRGEIIRLTASDAPDPGDVVQISSQVRANHRIRRSFLHYVVLGPNGTLVATRQVNLPAMRPDDTFSDSWSISNSSFPSKGTYTVFLCWTGGRGGPPRCDIDIALTTFYSVPTLGWALSLVALGLVGIFLWRRREDFRLGGAP